MPGPDTYTVVEVDLETAAQTVIASGGSRGDFVTPDPNDGSLLLTQTDQVIRLTFPTKQAFLWDNNYHTSMGTTEVDFEGRLHQDGMLVPMAYMVGEGPVFSQLGNPDAAEKIRLAAQAADASDWISTDGSLRKKHSAHNTPFNELDIGTFA